ncbi:hypothetical protein SERLA73DRAFT_110021 [Serpula lacrymans var. lacrymans S7.3]|uniref:Phosphodiest-domain-containing protein n=2 Tax=Serpula lacrymans var. lacrymans TaxID=341189 RepID=F8Q021_SERL3|nr:uncharacterized protein SERLADRAFT_409226 [Serpula lacrymans var. lacrymans S7.9]EGN98493.1 hypothetical protein SERLA73DRAFT_110021 [Serpula lacrymans var. lacrymans S7.3]EGO24070.1 hypothetical protein SERLADRAFT_409226 [Serpula lacrymans var. lacrymans S7.9]
MSHPNTKKAKANSPATEDELVGLLEDANLPEYVQGQPCDLEDQDKPQPTRSSREKKYATIAGVLIALIFGGALAKVLSTLRAASPAPGADDTLYSNGTHEFKKTVLIVSIDGLRADYLDRGFTPHLLDISKKGLRAKYMKPIFPTLTFPNHWALMTGLYAESHGIIANNFWDPVIRSEFAYNRPEASWNSSWWFGEPMWETAEKSGAITANLMWPGPPVTTSGCSPTYYIPWRNLVPLQEKLDQIMTWIDFPLETRPQLIMAYDPSLDQAGHLTGPMSALTNKTLAEVDIFAKDLHNSLEERNLTDIVDIIFVSDHGMTDTSHPEWVYLDDILGEGYDLIEHSDGWPSAGLRFKPGTNESKYLDILLNEAGLNPGRFDVFTHETMPERYHFANHYRIAPIYVVPNMHYALTNRVEGESGVSKGNHGYDNDEPSMRAMFVAHGPFSHGAKSSLSSLSESVEAWDSTSDDHYIMKGFDNVQIYSLVMRLLGIENTASTNGTRSFWDPYFKF